MRPWKQSSASLSSSASLYAKKDGSLTGKEEHADTAVDAAPSATGVLATATTSSSEDGTATRWTVLLPTLSGSTPRSANGSKLKVFPRFKIKSCFTVSDIWRETTDVRESFDGTARQEL